MKNKLFFSIVMPAYGVENYIENSVKSILNQTVEDFEIIIVDDCSPDKTGELADKLALLDNRISVIHLEKNGGVSNARNEGFKRVQGEYVFFMDPDDTIASDLLSQIKDTLSVHPADVTVYGIREEYFDGDHNFAYDNKIIFDDKYHYFTEQSELRKAVIDLERLTMYGYPWNKIFSTEYVKNSGVEFRKITLIEDIMFNAEIFQNISSLNILPITPYNYKKRINESLTNKFVPQYFDLHRTRVKMLYDQQKSWGTLGDYEKTVLANIYSRYIFSSLQRNCDERANMTHKDRKVWLKNLFNDDLWVSLSKYATVNLSLQGILSGFLKMKSICLCLMAGRFIYTVKVKLPIVFSKLK